MAAIPFQIELVQPERGLVIARRLEAIEFQVATETTLAGCPVTAMSLPPARGPDGQPRTDLFAFRLRKSTDGESLQVGAVVELAHYRAP